MSIKIKRALLGMAAAIIFNTAVAQGAVPHKIISDPRENMDTVKNILQYAVHKQLPQRYEKESLEALSHFPELKNTPIQFRIKKSLSTLKTRPRLISVFMPVGHRSYIITISNKTTDKLMPLLLANLSYAARVGIIGHELSHVADLSRRTTWQCFKVGMGHLSAKYLDHFEYNTDLICIRHGLGKDLEAWSSYIRNTMHTAFWRGAGYVNKMGNHERYMNPSTIEKNLNDTTGAHN